MERARVILLLFFLPLTILAQRKEFEKVRRLIPPRYVLLDSVFMDLNNDGSLDAALVVRHENETENDRSLRPMLIFTANSKGAMKLTARNDSVILCRSCGGSEKDPFVGVYASGHSLLISLTGGKQWKWTKLITFAWADSTKQLVLQSDEGSMWNSENTKDIRTFSYDKENFGKTTFREYRNTHLR